MFYTLPIRINRTANTNVGRNSSISSPFVNVPRSESNPSLLGLVPKSGSTPGNDLGEEGGDK
jgi:hypothetical protein